MYYSDMIIRKMESERILVRKLENALSGFKNQLIEQADYFKGMKELMEKNFITETMIQNYYFINPDFMFNGDHLSFVKSYILTQSKLVKNK